MMSLRNARLARLKTIFLDEMVKTFAAPKVGDQIMLLGLYADDLGEFTDDVIRAAYVTARREHKYSTWPRPETIRAECLAMVGGSVHGTTVDNGAWTPKDEFDVSPRDLKVNRKAHAAVDDFMRGCRDLAAVGNPAVRNYLHRLACKQIRAGSEVNLALPANLTAMPVNRPARRSVGAAAGHILDDVRGA